MEKFAQANVRSEPFPYAYIENVFPADYYQQLRAELPVDEHYARISVHDKLRGIAPSDSAPCLNKLRSKALVAAMLRAFGREATGPIDLEARLVRDRGGCRLPPHLDAPWRLLSVVFYLPADETHRRHGTSLYVPTGDDFALVDTLPFLPNSCFAVWNGANAWHGVEYVDEDFPRDLLIYNINDSTKRPPKRT